MSSVPSDLERDVILEFLDFYQKSKCLWDTSHPLYSNREARHDALTEMTGIYQKLSSEANVDMVKRKLENMRSAFKRESKKVSDFTLHFLRVFM